MIAVVKVAGQQYKVEKDQTLYVPQVEGKAGDKLDLEVLMVHADGKIATGDAITMRNRSVQGLALPEPVLRKIFHSNAARIFPGIAG